MNYQIVQIVEGGYSIDNNGSNSSPTAWSNFNASGLSGSNYSSLAAAIAACRSSVTQGQSAGNPPDVEASTPFNIENYAATWDVSDSGEEANDTLYGFFLNSLITEDQLFETYGPFYYTTFWQSPGGINPNPTFVPGTSTFFPYSLPFDWSSPSTSYSWAQHSVSSGGLYANGKNPTFIIVRTSGGPPTPPTTQPLPIPPIDITTQPILPIGPPGTNPPYYPGYPLGYEAGYSEPYPLPGYPAYKFLLRGSDVTGVMNGFFVMMSLALPLFADYDDATFLRQQSLDMNGKSINNLAAGTDNNDLVRRDQVS